MISAKCTKTPIEPKEPLTPLEQLPEATQVGANTLGCLVDGEVFTPKGNVYYKGIEKPRYTEENGILRLRFLNLKDFEDKWIYIYLYIKNGVYSIGNYTDIAYSSQNSTYPAFEIYNDVQNAFTKFYIDSNSLHYIEITKLDLENKIVSGLFEFTVMNEDKTDTIKITDGRFDLNNLFIQ
ncbi:hypothetical protein DNU06_17330 [Putridiphycobacter roseus]|uniref:Uncharacterized protein n=2 Tax=Putridiphycobacter roseus TaxID=2219161 RepID=A0A2W1MYF3_9FLAO|nr:hypothetical protein DNU06_17330 [Putridiphycobacter roseus]